VHGLDDLAADRLTIPLGGLRLVLRYDDAVVVEGADVVGGLRVPRFRRLLEPAECPCLVAVARSAGVKGNAKVVLRVGIAALQRR
jgi:hypothetical protein